MFRARHGKDIIWIELQRMGLGAVKQGNKRHDYHNGEMCVALDGICNLSGKLEPKSKSFVRSGV